jgi:uncharacterized repeat protein (TIGR04138 family)
VTTVERDRDDVLRELVRRDARYPEQAYLFVLEALDFTIKRRGKGRKHVGGVELIEGFRDLSLDTFGLLARAVLAEWNVTTTSDVGSIVFRMIEEDLLQKTADDRREDFDDVFDFAETFENGFRETLSKVAI